MTEGATRAQDITPEDFRSALQEIPAAVVILTTHHAGQDLAQTVTATAICSGSTEPPSLLISLRDGAPFSAALQRSQVVSVNYVAADQHELVRSFVETGPSGDFAASEAWSRRATGAPVLRDCVLSLDCKVTRAATEGSNIVFTTQVQAIHTAEKEGLLYRNGLLRRLEGGS